MSHYELQRIDNTAFAASMDPEKLTLDLMPGPLYAPYHFPLEGAFTKDLKPITFEVE